MFRKTLFATLAFAATAAFAGDELEPCINGGVSAGGNFPNQEMADQIQAYLQWKGAEPYYLFKVASRGIPEAYPEK